MKGIIKFDSNPEGANIFINNEYLGQTPLDIEDTSPGIYVYSMQDSTSEENKFSSELQVYHRKITHIVADFTTNSITKEYIDITNDEISFTKTVTHSSTESSSDEISQEEKQTSEETEKKQPSEEDQQSGVKEEPNSQVQNNKEDTTIKLLTSINSKLDFLNKYMGESLGYDLGQKTLTSAQTAITVATPNRPIDETVIANPNTSPVTPGYDRILVYDILGRKAPFIELTNYGSDILYVKVSHERDIFSRDEFAILKGGTITFTNVYELRIRSPHAGNLSPSVGTQPGGIYGISQFQSKYNNYNLNKPAIFVNAIENVPIAGAGFAYATLTGDIINLPSSFASSVENTDYIYYTYQGADLTFATRSQLGTLAPGDVLIPNGTRGLTVYFASKSLPDQIIEVTTDTDLS